MKILVVSDLHGSLNKLQELLTKETTADLLLFAVILPISAGRSRPGPS